MSKKKDENLATVTKNRAVKIFKALGFSTAGQWDAFRLQKKVNKLQTLVEGANLDDKTQKRVNEILRVQNAGRTVQVVDSEMVATDEQVEKEVEAAAKREVNRKAEKRVKEKKTEEKQGKIKRDVGKSEKKSGKKTVKKTVKKTAKKTAKKVGKKATKKIAKKTTELDKFGSRNGSSTSKINAVLARKPKKMAQLIEESGLSGTHYDHLKKLIDAGHVEKTDKGFRLTK